MTNENDTPTGTFEPDWSGIDHRVGAVFTPAVPVSEKEMFAGRMDQIQRVVDAVNQRGQHVIIYGERGVGKTSLANILASRMEARTPVLSPRINCDSMDNFGSLWQKLFMQVDLIHDARPAGFGAKATQESVSAGETMGGEPTPEVVRRMLERLTDDQIVVAIFDEFDRVTDQGARRAMADTIKALSDHDIRATIIIVGVADTVGELVAEHASIERALAQIPMPRMTRPELEEILERGTQRLDMSISKAARDQITMLAQGLPHYVQLLGLHAARHAIRSHRLQISDHDVMPAMTRAVEQAQQSLQDDYRQAVASPQKGTLHNQVLLACSLADTDDFGYFTAGDVRDPLSKIAGKPCDIPSFAKHLNDFCQPARGSVLRKSGQKNRYFYRFASPLMQPLVIMRGMIEGHIPSL